MFRLLEETGFKRVRCGGGLRISFPQRVDA